jgi:hypothetical protein
MCAAVMLVCDVIFKTPTVAVVVAVLALAFAWTWFGYPLTRRLRGERSSR